MSAPARLPLIEEIRPAPDAFEVFLRLAHLPSVVFFDSALRGGELGRYSYIAAEPFESLEVTLPATRPGVDPFERVRPWLARFASATAAAGASEPELRQLPPFRGGAAGLFGYGLARSLEEIPPARIDEFALPDLKLELYDWVVSFDHEAGRAWFVAWGFPETDATRRSARAAAEWSRVRELLRVPRPEPAKVDRRRASLASEAVAASDLAPCVPLADHPGVVSAFSRAGFEAAVARAIEYVRAGDVFQVNLAQRLLAPWSRGPVELYASLRDRNPAPFAAYFDLGTAVIASASPERFLCVSDGWAHTRPIKGTRPRGHTPESDGFSGEELFESAKDRAENVMIVDLLRNDLSRVCRPGTVTVPRLFEIESYRTVHHLVSEVRGQLKEGLGPLELLRAAFPGGSVTGAPKVRATEIIAELEPVARGPYCGSLAWIGFDGSMDSSILIRTATLSRGWLQFPVGGGIVAGSRPDREYRETLDKAAGMLRAIED